ncbi:hypothetical protein EDC01DRAFT_167324 [Geopyxis carbonaria]|nr:hypothetical protein EDC01DRAFT_167324 [Geopyxis carbonaria]
MDFAPYQSESPDTSRKSFTSTRPLSPPSTSRSYSPLPSAAAAARPPVLPTHQPGGGWAAQAAQRSETVGQFETSLPIRLDWEAVLAYVLLPPAGGVLLLITEHKSDYVRFHAWQSALLFAFLVVVHVVFSFSAFVSWTLLAADLALMGWLAARAYRDADTLDRCEVPFFGPLASSILDDE